MRSQTHRPWLLREPYALDALFDIFLASASYAGSAQTGAAAHCSGEQIRLGNPAVEFCVSPDFLTGGRIMADNSLIVLWSAERHLNIETHLASQWGYTDSHFSAIPAALILGELGLFNGELLTELVAVRQMIATDTGFIRAGERAGSTFNIYYSIGDQITYLFVEHKQTPDVFSQITIHGFTEPEVIQLLEGISDGRLN